MVEYGVIITCDYCGVKKEYWVRKPMVHEGVGEDGWIKSEDELRAYCGPLCAAKAKVIPGMKENGEFN